jgi:hypothetical protein
MLRSAGSHGCCCLLLLLLLVAAACCVAAAPAGPLKSWPWPTVLTTLQELELEVSHIKLLEDSSVEGERCVGRPQLDWLLLACHDCMSVVQEGAVRVVAAAVHLA